MFRRRNDDRSAVTPGVAAAEPDSVPEPPALFEELTDTPLLPAVATPAADVAAADDTELSALTPAELLEHARAQQQALARARQEAALASEAARAERDARKADRAAWNTEQSALRAQVSKDQAVVTKLTAALDRAHHRIDHVADRHCEILMRTDHDACCAECGDRVPCFTVKALWQGDSRKELPSAPQTTESES